MPIRTVGIIGAGTMGSGIAQVFATAGFDVVLTDASEAAAERGAAAVADNLERLVAKAKISAEDRAAALRRIAPSSRHEDLGPVDLLIEAAPEDAELKAGIFRRIDPIVRPEAIVASNTSSVSITRLASAISRPDRFVGLHFFNPVPVMRLVEVVRGLQTSDATHDAVEALVIRLGKTPITVKSSPGFVVNRHPAADAERGPLRARRGQRRGGGHRRGDEARVQPPDRPARPGGPHRARCAPVGDADAPQGNG